MGGAGNGHDFTMFGDWQGRGNRKLSGVERANGAGIKFTLLVGLMIVKGVMNKPRAVTTERTPADDPGFADQWPSWVNYRSASTPGQWRWRRRTGRGGGR